MRRGTRGDPARRIRVVGCGSPDGGDDRLGILAARRLREMLPPDVDIVEDRTGGVHVDAWCEGVDALFVVDAAAAGPGCPAGSQLRFRYPRDRGLLERLALRGTHVIPLEEGLRLAEVLGLLPPEVWIYAVTGSRFEMGKPFSAELEGPLGELVEAIRCEVEGRIAGGQSG